jgi:hypothetical protein
VWIPNSKAADSARTRDDEWPEPIWKRGPAEIGGRLGGRLGHSDKESRQFVGGKENRTCSIPEFVKVTDLTP